MAPMHFARMCVEKASYELGNIFFLDHYNKAKMAFEIWEPSLAIALVPVQ